MSVFGGREQDFWKTMTPRRFAALLDAYRGAPPKAAEKPQAPRRSLSKFLATGGM